MNRDHSALANAIGQVLQYLKIFEPVKVRASSPLREGERIMTLDFVVMEKELIKAETVTYFKRAIRFELVYADEDTCRRVWQSFREFAVSSGRSGGGYFNFDPDNKLRKPKKKRPRKNWKEIDIPCLISKIRSRTDATGLVSKILFNKVLLEMPATAELSMHQKQGFKQYLAREGCIEEILHGKRVAGYRLKDGEASPRPKSGVFRLEDARIETLLGIFATSNFAHYLRAAKKVACGEKIKMRTLVRLSKEHLNMPADLVQTTWYDGIVIKALLESGYFERAAASAGYLQFSLNAYDLMELGSEASKFKSRSESQ